MLTIFALPKAFQGHIKVIQNNAIRSWTKLRPSCEIILFGTDEGTAEIADELGIRHVPDVAKNEYGTPLVSSLFSTAQKVAGNDLVSYVNADIILTQSFMEAVRRIQKQRFLLIGRRWDLDVDEPLDFSSPDWEKKLLARLAESGKLHGYSGLDYSVFPRGLYRDIPPFALGRTAWDNWLVYRARSLKMLVIDATGAITIIHQNHEYARFQGVNEGSAKGERKGLEGRRNRELLGGPFYAFHIWDATHILAPDGLKPARSIKHQLWRLYRLPELHPHLIPLVQIIRVLRTVLLKTAALRRKWRGKLKQNG